MHNNVFVIIVAANTIYTIILITRKPILSKCIYGVSLLTKKTASENIHLAAFFILLLHFYIQLVKEYFIYICLDLRN
jgi:hypothetical protein